MTEKPKKTPEKELECPARYVYDTGIIFECTDNSRVEILGEDVIDLLNELTTKCSKLEKENEQLKQTIAKIDFAIIRKYDNSLENLLDEVYDGEYDKWIDKQVLRAKKLGDDGND